MYEELYHHGIKGQRWGVRRQKKYNTMTKEKLREKRDAWSTYKSVHTISRQKNKISAAISAPAIILAGAVTANPVLLGKSIGMAAAYIGGTGVSNFVSKQLEKYSGMRINMIDKALKEKKSKLKGG